MLIVLGICLPVPLFAATGLTIPLPASVERLAAALVPWVETALVDSNSALLRGTITLAPGERRESRLGHDVPALVVSDHRSSSSSDGSSQGGGGVKATKETEAGSAPQPVSPEAGPAPSPDESTSGESNPGPSPKPDPGEKSSDGPGPIQGTVDTVNQTVGSTVGSVEDTADEVLSPVTGVTDTLEGTVTGLLPGLGG